MLSSQRIIAEAYATQLKKVINNKLPTTPKFTNTIGNEIIPDPIAVPANNEMAANCLFITTHP
jgi:hypothetical protein